MRIANRQLYLCFYFLGAIFWPQDVAAFLGSFEEQDGYRIPMNGQILSGYLAGDAQFYLNNNSANGYTGVVPLGAYPNTMGDGTNGPDVSRYNAGQYGTTNGGPGGGATDITDNSGLWSALAGGRLNEDANAPYYYGSQFARDQIVAYRSTMAHAGAQTLNLQASDQNLSYLYRFDSRDFGGVDPASTAGLRVQMSFWVTPSDWDDPDTGNIFGLSLLDAANQSVFEVGYTGDNLLQYRLSGGAWQTTAYQLGTTGWSQIIIGLDTVANTASLGVRAYDDSNSLLGGNISVLGSESLGLISGALTGLQWDLRGGALDNGAVSYINSFDDFSLSLAVPAPVPEPGCLTLLLLAIAWLHAPRQRRGNRPVIAKDLRP